MSEEDKFAELVAKMREAQKEFFRTHSQQALRRSKQYEGYVDHWLKKIGMDKNQGTLLAGQSHDSCFGERA